jgi:hypothetical protein
VSEDSLVQCGRCGFRADGSPTGALHAYQAHRCAPEPVLGWPEVAAIAVVTAALVAILWVLLS